MVHFDFFIWAIQAVLFVCYMVATGGNCGPRACPQGLKKGWKNKIFECHKRSRDLLCICLMSPFATSVVDCEAKISRCGLRGSLRNSTMGCKNAISFVNMLEMILGFFVGSFGVTRPKFRGVLHK